MTPVKIVRESLRRGLSIIAITDHNSAENAGSVIRAAAATELNVIPGIEINTVEEIHIVGLFDTLEHAESIQRKVYDRLLPGENDPELFGLQVIASSQDEVDGFNRRMLIGATTLSIDEVLDLIHESGGIAIAAHIDRPSNSIYSQLGFIPGGLHLDALEISRQIEPSSARNRFNIDEDITIISSSDAHAIGEIGARRTSLTMDSPVFSELRLALLGSSGRCACVAQG
jgi:hypothetical protein